MRLARDSDANRLTRSARIRARASGGPGPSAGQAGQTGQIERRPAASRGALVRSNRPPDSDATRILTSQKPVEPVTYRSEWSEHIGQNGQNGDKFVKAVSGRSGPIGQSGQIGQSAVELVQAVELVKAVKLRSKRSKWSKR